MEQIDQSLLEEIIRKCDESNKVKMDEFVDKIEENAKE